MKETHQFSLKRYIHRHSSLAAIYEWFLEHWPMVVIFVLALAVILCLVNLTVMVLMER